MVNEIRNTKPTVSVVMITYGHEAFIRQAVEGVLMQECNFPVELIVADDHSPDATPQIMEEILKSHPRTSWIRYTRHSQNKGMSSNFIWALCEAKGKYIALCEGDDYWNDSFKLQKQVDFLEINPSYSLTATKYVKFFQENNTIERTPELNQDETISIITIDNFLKNYVLGTNTVVYRNNLIEYSDSNQKGFKDIFLFALLLEKGDCALINQYMSTYRIHAEGNWSMKKPLELCRENYNTAKAMKHHFGYAHSSINDFYVYTTLAYLTQLKELKAWWLVFKIKVDILILILIGKINHKRLRLLIR